MSDRVRIFHLIKSLGRGGAETLLPESLRFADRDRFDYDFGYFLPWKDALVPALATQGARVTCFGGGNNLQILLAARRIAAELRRRRVDVLHCHLPIAGVVGRLAGRMTGVPVIYTEHNKQERYHGLTRRLNSASWSWQERVIAVSADVADSIARHMGRRVPVAVVLNGVDVEWFRRTAINAAAVRSELGIPQEARVVGTVAVFRSQKRLGDWLEAARAVRDRHPGTHFLLVGAGPLYPETVARAAELGLGGSVHFAGLQQEVRPYLAAMDVYMMSSVFEGLPVALLEAMSMGCAPVCTAVGGIPEVISHGQNGYLVEAGRPEELARSVATLLDDGAGLREVGLRARGTIVQGFGMNRMARQIEEIYLEMMEARNRGG